MIVTLKAGVHAQAIGQRLVALGLWVERLEGDGRVCFQVGPSSRRVSRESLLSVDGVEAVLSSRSAHPLVDAGPRTVRAGGHELGVGCEVLILAGPCAVESEEQIERLAAALAARGASFLRGGAFKPRTSPYAFQGHGAEALAWMRRAADAHGLSVVTEVMSELDAEVVAEHADLLQIGSRNMHNPKLLERASKTGRPILLKRGMAATIEEWLSAGEYCLLHGAPGVVFCERGVRGFDPSTRNLLDLAAVALLAEVHHVPVVADLSHAVGRRDLIPPLARAAIAAGAHGLVVEVHDDPGAALSDGPQALHPDELTPLVRLAKTGGQR